jgi:RND family efflux transporter MFP subunit
MVVFVLVGILVISAAGYFGFSTAQEPELTPAPQTVTVNRCDVDQTVTAPGNLVNIGLENINMPTTGKLSEVYIRIGDVVKDGQVLAEMDAVAKSEAQSKLIEAQAELDAAQRKRTSMDYPRATDAFIKEYRAKIKLQKQLVGQLAAMYENAIGPEAKSAALMQLSNAQTELSTMENNLKWYLGHPSEVDLAAADSELSLTQAKYDAARVVLESLSIVAPFDGVVLESKAQTGVTINAETPLFKVGDPKELEVQANITEEDFPIVAVGQEVELFFDARPELTIRGRVSRIIPRRIEGESSPLYDIYITLDEVPDGLADGMTADTAITIAKRENVLCLPRAVVRASSGDTTIVKVWDGVQEAEREITVGLRGDTYVEIVSGLSEGEQVVTR